MPETIIAANWKMNKTSAEAAEFARGLKNALAQKPAAGIVVVAPSFTSLAAVASELKDSPVRLSAQNMHAAEKGALTGEISGAMLKDAGCQYCIIGHSERRTLFGENDSVINAKIAAALSYGLRPIFCIGETLAEREANTTFNVITRQLKEGLNNISASDMNRVVVAYEPVWAIGTGKTATPGQAQGAHIFIRKLLGEIYGESAAASVSIIYGGSVSDNNISVLMAQKDINGALVGSASLDLNSFLNIINFR